MQPNHYDLLSQTPTQMTRDDYQLRENAIQPRSSPAVPHRSEDSWIEVSSQPSSSSLSSTNDDIITTGLRVQRTETNEQRYRYCNRRPAPSTPSGYSSREPGSSQDEYEESESEEDRVLSSSNEEMDRRPFNPLLQMAPAPSGATSSDEDDNVTALGGRVSTSRFVPQPNVFSHPPVSRNPSWTRPTEARRSAPSEVSNSSHRTAINRASQASVRTNRPSRQPDRHSPYSMISPSHHADHDAALRASLSTLLSCAAAARGLPKSESQPSAGPSRQPPSSFRLVPESVAMGEEDNEDRSHPVAETTPTADPSRKHPNAGPAYTGHVAPAHKKRRSSSPRARSPSASKKNRRGAYYDSAATGPTVMTWVLSAGVVVLFSAISFSAGYMLGREMGRMELSTGIGPADGVTGGTTSTASSQQAVEGGLKRLRWGSSGTGSGVLA